MKSETVSRVLRGELCTGCGLCAAVSRHAIRMESAPPGYARPVQIEDISADIEAVIADACPGAKVQPWPSGPKVHPYWGACRQVLTGAATSPEVKFEGSSGGAISALLIHCLETGLVDRVVHVSPDSEDPTRNMTAVSRTVEEVIQRAGSRYAPSSPLSTIDAELAAGGAFAFVGKPCDVSALRRLALHDERVERHVPVSISFFCGGIPSHAGVERILRTLGMQGEPLTEFRFRGRGWPGDCVATSERRTASMSYAESWGGHLSKEVQFRCKICPDAVGGAADIACADAWYGDEDGYPSFDEQEGRSLIITRTEKGDGLLEDARKAGVLSAETLPIAEVDKMQPSQARRKRLVLARTASLPATLNPSPRMGGLKVVAAAMRATPAEAAKNFLGTIRRTLRGTRSRL